MSKDLVEIHPETLKFVFVPKKRISCSVRLTNKSNRHVAFKSKTTHPKTYIVNPNQGVIEPGSTCEVTVTREAQAALPPPHVVAKEKLLFQTTLVPEGTSLGSLASAFGCKDGGECINEKKLLVEVVGLTTTEKMMEAKIERGGDGDGDGEGKKKSPFVLKCFNVKLA